MRSKLTDACLPTHLPVCVPAHPLCQDALLLSAGRQLSHYALPPTPAYTNCQLACPHAAHTPPPTPAWCCNFAAGSKPMPMPMPCPQIDMARVERGPSSFPNPVVLLAPMDKQQMDTTLASHNWSSKMEVSAQWAVLDGEAVSD